MADLFKDILPSILQTKEYVLTDEKDYVPYVINRALSYHYDCILYANEMNCRPHMDGRMQYDYLLHTVRGYKRPFQKWQRREKNDDLEAVKEYHKYSTEKARQALAILTTDQINSIKQALDKGGLKAAKKLK